jgi:glycine C-acetyltransferase
LGGKVLNWSLNDYLGLANHPEVRKADRCSLSTVQLSHGARMMSGHTKYHEQLENELAAFVMKECLFIKFWVPRLCD